MLFILLILLGGAGAVSYVLLEQVTRNPTAADVAQRVCTAYTTQNYQLLIDQIDPTPIAGQGILPSSVSSSGPFSSQVKSELVDTLKSLDASAGPVTSCQQHQLAFKGSSARPTSIQFVFTMRRADTPKVTYSAVMNFVRRNGTWMITRDSNFTGTPG
jgi:hypothetical protein